MLQHLCFTWERVEREGGNEDPLGFRWAFMLPQPPALSRDPSPSPAPGGHPRPCSLPLGEVPLGQPAQAQPSRQRGQRVPRLPSFPGTSGGRRAHQSRSPRESLIPPRQVLSSMPSGEEGWRPAPACSPGSGLPALGPAPSA